MDANVLGQIRTGAISAMVTTMLVKKQRINYTIIGSGFQSESQLNSISEYYELENAYVYSRNFEHAKKFAEKSRIKVEPVKDLSCLKESGSKYMWLGTPYIKERTDEEKAATGFLLYCSVQKTLANYLQWTQMFSGR